MLCEKDSLFMRICDLIYSKISARAVFAKERHSITNEDIYIQNPAIASNIITNTRTKNNPYLVPGRTCTINGKKQNQAEEVARNLCYESVNDFLWGNRVEFRSYSGEFFKNLILDAMGDATEEEKTVIKDALSYYTPYARLSTYNDLCKTDYYKALNFEIDYDEKEEFEIKYEALTRLYMMIEEDFISSYFDFFYGKTTLKLNRTIASYVSTTVIPMIKKAIANDNSFGKTAKEIISTIAQNMNNEIMDNLPLETLSSRDRYKLKTNEEFVNASFKYFKNLEKYQIKMEGRYNYKTMLIDSWSTQLLNLKGEVF